MFLLRWQLQEVLRRRANGIHHEKTPTLTHLPNTAKKRRTKNKKIKQAYKLLTLWTESQIYFYRPSAEWIKLRWSTCFCPRLPIRERVFVTVCCVLTKLQKKLEIYLVLFPGTQEKPENKTNCVFSGNFFTLLPSLNTFCPLIKLCLVLFLTANQQTHAHTHTNHSV